MSLPAMLSVTLAARETPLATVPNRSAAVLM